MQHGCCGTVSIISKGFRGGIPPECPVKHHGNISKRADGAGAVPCLHRYYRVSTLTDCLYEVKLVRYLRLIWTLRFTPAAGGGLKAGSDAA